MYFFLKKPADYSRLIFAQQGRRHWLKIFLTVTSEESDEKWCKNRALWIATTNDRTTEMKLAPPYGVAYEVIVYS